MYPQLSLGYRWHIPKLGLGFVNISTYGNYSEQREGIDQSLTLGFKIKPTTNILIKNSDSFYQQKMNGETGVLYETLLSSPRMVVQTKFLPLAEIAKRLILQILQTI